MRAVDHLAVDGKNACVRMCLERGNDFLGMPYLGIGRSERSIDYGNLSGVYREFAGEALAPSGFGFGAQAVRILKVGEHAIDRLDTRRHSTGQAQRASEPVGEAELAI